MADIDSPLDQQERYIAYGSGVYFVIVIALIILTAKLQSSIQEQINNILPADLYKDLLAVASITAVSFAIGYFIKYLGIHKYADQLFFRFKDQLDCYITGSLKEYAGKCGIEIKPEVKCQLLDVFFEFINKQDDSHAIQRALYFSYYTKYGLSINLLVLSLFGFSVTLGINLYNNNYSDYATLTYGFFIIIGTLAYLVSQFKIRKEILYEITRRQIYRIIYDEEECLKEKLVNRFGCHTANTVAKDESESTKPQENPFSPEKVLRISPRFARIPRLVIITTIDPLVVMTTGILLFIGILLIFVGISEGLVAPIFSGIVKATNQTDQPAQFLPTTSLVFLVPGVILFILGALFRWKWKLEPKQRQQQE